MPTNVVILIEIVIIVDTILLDICYCYKLFRFFKYGLDNNNTYSNHTITAVVTCFSLLVLFCSSIIMERTALY